MGIECLIVTSDPALIGQIKANLDPHGASLDLRQDSASAIELACRRHLDGLVIDCDDVPGGTNALIQVRNSRSNKQTPIFAVVNGATNAGAALDLGANFVLGKPIQEGHLRSVIESAVPKMEREHRRYFRYDVDVPAQFRNHLGQSFNTRVKNVSECGLAVKLVDPFRLEGVVVVEFELPSLTREGFRAKADVVWSDSFAMGLRFLYVEKESGAALQSWLGSLEAQCRFRALLQHPS
jgi:CheY-like chemotaxis protein